MTIFVSEDLDEALRCYPSLSAGFLQVDVKFLALRVSDRIRRPRPPVGLERSRVLVKKELNRIDDGKIEIFPTDRHNGCHRFLDGLLAGELALPAGNTPEPFVDADDIADVAVAALTEDGHVGEVYELTGPRLLTFSDAVGEIAEATGREIRYVSVSVEDFAAALEAQGVPGEWIELLVYLFQEVLDGRNAHLADGVQRALGREPRDFADYARDAAATGVWTPALARAYDEGRGPGMPAPYTPRGPDKEVPVRQ